MIRQQKLLVLSSIAALISLGGCSSTTTPTLDTAQYCYTDEKCKPIPKGFKMVGRAGYLRKENGHSVDDDENKNGNGSNGNGNGSNGNGIALFTYAGSNLPNTPVVTVSSIASNGRDAETTDEIKYNVSHKYRTQDRAVTASDYIDIIQTSYPNIDSINCWGGESMSPPIYGKIYISINFYLV